MGSCSVICDPTQVNTRQYCSYTQPARPVLDLPTMEGWKAELTQLHTEMVLPVYHPSSNLAQCRTTSLTETHTLSTHATTTHTKQHQANSKYTLISSMLTSNTPSHQRRTVCNDKVLERQMCAVPESSSWYLSESQCKNPAGKTVAERTVGQWIILIRSPHSTAEPISPPCHHAVVL